VSDATREDADAFQFLCLQQHFFGVPPVCDVVRLPSKLAVTTSAHYGQRAFCEEACAVSAHLPALVIGSAVAIRLL
jgi:hypothetical protein